MLVFTKKPVETNNHFLFSFADLDIDGEGRTGSSSQQVRKNINIKLKSSPKGKGRGRKPPTRGRKRTIEEDEPLEPQSEYLTLTTNLGSHCLLDNCQVYM